MNRSFPKNTESEVRQLGTVQLWILCSVIDQHAFIEVRLLLSQSFVEWKFLFVRQQLAHKPPLAPVVENVFAVVAQEMGLRLRVGGEHDTLSDFDRAVGSH